MFFIKTEERTVTRQELLSIGRHTEYLTSIVCDGEDEERGFVSGVSTIQKKWDPYDLRVDLEAADVAGSIMAEVNKLVDDPKDLAVIQKIIEKTIAYCENEPREAETELVEDMRSAGEDSFSKQHMVRQVREELMKLFYQERCRLVWNGNICSEVTAEPVAMCEPVRNEPVRNEHGIVDVCYTHTSTRLNVTLGSELKLKAENDFFSEYIERSWQGVNAIFRLKMLNFPENMAIEKLRGYFGAMADLLQAKTVFESDMRENPINIRNGMVYFPPEIWARLGTRLVEEVQGFGWALKQNRCFKALCAFEKIQRLQKESCKITDQRVKEMTIEALSVLNQNWDVLKKYFDIWDTYIGNIICSDQGVDAYIENISLADYGSEG